MYVCSLTGTFRFIFTRHWSTKKFRPRAKKVSKYTYIYIRVYVILKNRVTFGFATKKKNQIPFSLNVSRLVVFNNHNVTVCTYTRSGYVINHPANVHDRPYRVRYYYLTFRQSKRIIRRRFNDNDGERFSRVKNVNIGDNTVIEHTFIVKRPLFVTRTRIQF